MIDDRVSAYETPDASFLRSVIDALPSHVAVLDETGTVVEVNEPWREFARQNGGSADLIGPGTNYLEVCDRAAESDADSASDVGRGIREVIGGVRTHYHMCYPCHSPDQQRWFQVRVTRCAKVDPLRVVVAHESITETQELERLSRQYQSDLAHMMRLGTINEMAAGLAHELNQPLATISNYAAGCLRRLESLDDPEKIREALSTIVSESQRAGEILRRVRRFVDRGRELQERVRLDETLRDAIALVSSEARASGVTLELDVESDPTLVTLGDPVQIQQVLVNVMRNAVEAIRDTPRELEQKRVIARAAHHHPSNVRVDVIDTGPGSPKEVVPLLFDPFFSTKAGEGAARREGRGLGLSLCRSIIDTHRGEIWADHNRYGGLTVSFTLPLATKDDHADG